MQVDPIKPTLKATESKPLKLEHEKTLSNFAFKVNVRRYTTGGARPAPCERFLAAVAKAGSSG